MVWHTATPPALWLLTRSLQGPLLGVSREPQAKLRGVAEAASLPVLEACTKSVSSGLDTT